MIPLSIGTKRGANIFLIYKNVVCFLIVNNLSRYNECKEKLLPYLKKLGFNPQKDLTFMPCSGLTGAGLKEPVDPKLCPWFT